MLGVIIIAIVLVVGIPVGVMMSGAAAAAGLGWALKDEAETANAGSELLDTNV